MQFWPRWPQQPLWKPQLVHQLHFLLFGLSSSKDFGIEVARFSRFSFSFVSERSELKWILGHEVITSVTSDGLQSLLLASLTFNQILSRTRNVMKI